ncbi:MAG: YncE family protein [Terriglobales bacterium]
MRYLRFFGLAVAALAMVTLAGAQDAPPASRPDGYHVVKTIPLNNSHGWDYMDIDTAKQRLYVSASTKEIVLNARTYAVIGTIPGLKGTHGVGISDRDNHGFTSNGGGNDSTEFNLRTLRVIKTIPLPIQRPDGIIYDPASDRIFYFNHDSHAAAVNAADGTVAGTILLPTRAAEFAAADGRGHVFDNLESSSQEIEINSRTLKVMHVWPLAPCTSPSGLAIDRASHRLFVGCDNHLLAVVNSDNGKVVTTVPIGGGVDATRFDPKTKLVFSSNGEDGTITVIHEDSPDQYTVVGNVPTARGARTMEVDTTTGTLFTVTAKFEPRKPGQPRYRRTMVPGSFELIVAARQ